MKIPWWVWPWRKPHVFVQINHGPSAVKLDIKVLGDRPITFEMSGSSFSVAS